MGKIKLPNTPSIAAADGRTYMNVQYHGYPDPQQNCARILQKMIEVKARADAFQQEINAKQAKIQVLEEEASEARVYAYVNDDFEFPDITEVAALKSDIQELQARKRAAREATQILAGEFDAVRMENVEDWTEALREAEQKLLDRYEDVLREYEAILADWRNHATMVEHITGERQFLDVANPTRPILLKDPGDVVMSTATAGSLT